MINVRLMRQQARQENIVVTDQEVEARVAEILQTAGREQVLGFMQARGLTALTFRQFMHDSLLQEKLMARHVPAPAATVEARQVRHVLAQTAEQAATARDRLAKGESWEKVAAEVSIDPGSKDRGGDLGFLTPGQTVPPFDQAAFSLPLNELSEVVQTQFGYHVLMATEARTQPASPQQVAAQRQQAFSQYLQSLRQAAAIETYQ
jgi:parvulin-like peptidyl-prolyl isomerase